MPRPRKPQSKREQAQRANRKQPLDAKRRGGLARWAGMTDEQKAELVEKLRVATVARRARLQASQGGPDAQN